MRIGILGAGNMGRTHAAAYARMPDVEIVAIVGRREARVKEVTDSFGGTALTDPWKVLDDDTIDAIDVCYPTFMHREYAVAALQRGKHVFCETPIALSVEDADAMIAAARSSGKLLLVALLMRLDPYEAECRYFFDCVQGVADPALLSAEAAHDALRVALAAKESLERGGERVMLNRER